jgi:hypothetical protein
MLKHAWLMTNEARLADDEWSQAFNNCCDRNRTCVDGPRSSELRMSSGPPLTAMRAQ